MNKAKALKFIKANVYVLEMLKAEQFAGRLTREEVAEYKEVYKFIDPKADVCFTCGRSPQVMASRMLTYKKDCSVSVKQIARDFNKKK